MESKTRRISGKQIEQAKISKDAQADSAAVKVALSQTNIVAKDDDQTIHFLPRKAYFGRNMTLCLYLIGADTNLKYDLKQPLTLGRDKPATDGENHLDLTPYGAVKQGVSRQHLRLSRAAVTLMAEDQGSRNGSFLNGEKLPSARSQVICNGDMLTLGTLMLKVVFEEGDQPEKINTDAP